MTQTDILGNFYRRMLPLYQPRTEAVLRHTDKNQLKNLTFRYIFTVDGMIEISRMIEGLVTASPKISDTHVSFQYFSRIAPQLNQYQSVAQASKGLWLYGIPDTTLPNLISTTFVDTTNTPLENYWFVIAYGAGLSATLLAEEITPAERLPGEPRIYEGFYTFEVDTTYQVLAVLSQMFPNLVHTPQLPELLK